MSLAATQGTIVFGRCSCFKLGFPRRLVFSNYCRDWSGFEFLQQIKTFQQKIPLFRPLSQRIALFLPSLVGGGAERVFVQLANEFVASACKVDFVLVSAYGPYLDEIADGVRIVDLRATGTVRSLPRLVRYLRTERPDAMLSGLDHANLVAILACAAAGGGTRCVISERAVPTAVYMEDRSLRGRITPYLMRFAYRFSDSIIANSQFVAADLAGPLRIPKSKLRVVYNPLDLRTIDELARKSTNHPWCAAGMPPFALSVGRLDRFKDYQTLIRAFAMVRSQRDCRLVILGEGPERAKLEASISELGLQREVLLPGFVSNPFAWMRQAAVFVSSSLTEGCPNALMQALACGTSVVSTDCVGGSSEILEGGKWGRLVPVGAPEAMAAAIVATLDSAHRPDVRKRAASFAISGIAQEYLRILLRDSFSPQLEH